MDERKSGGLGPVPLVIGAVLIIAAAVFFFTRGEVPTPTPDPNSPAAVGTAGQPETPPAATGTEAPATPAPAAPASN